MRYTDFPLWKSLSVHMELLTVGSVRSESTPVEIDTSVTYLPKGKGATLGAEGIEYGR